MNPQRWRRARELFDAAVEMQPTARSQFLARECADDPELRVEVADLLSADDVAEADDNDTLPIVDRLPIQAVEKVLAPLSLIGTRVGAYEIRSVLGTGGMGAVYAAVQDTPQRTVAVKVMRRGLRSANSVRRFQFEAEVLARLRHEAIAQIFEAGVHKADEGDVPYFAMEFVEGARDLIDYANDQRMTVRDKVSLMIKVCAAVQHGHERGVVHRDLKPANILVDAHGNPKVIDFGIARCSNSDLETQAHETKTGQVLGTLQFMSPEQVSSSSSDVDGRADVYALGVVLYKLLSGHLPHEIDDVPLTEAIRIVTEVDIRPLGQVDKTFRGDLETIVAEATEKDRERRYSSASDLADDLNAFLAHLPISARPPSRVYQVRKFTRRHRSLVASLATVFCLSIGSSIIVGCQNQAIQKQHNQALLISEILGDVLAEPGVLTPKGPELTLVDALDATSRRIDDRNLEPEIEGYVRDTLGRSYYQLSLYDQARHHLTRAFALRADAHGPDARKTFETGSLLGLALLRTDDEEQAESFLGDLQERCSLTLGPKDSQTLELQHNRALALRALDRGEEAENCLRKVLRIRTEQLGPDAISTLNSAHCLGRLLASNANSEEDAEAARTVLEDTLARRARVLQPTHPDTSITRDVLGEVYASLGKLERAEAIHREAYQNFCNSLGDNHTHSLAAGFHLTKVLAYAGRFEEMSELADKLHAGCTERYGPSHSTTRKLATMVAGGAMQRGDFKLAIKHFREILEQDNRARGPDHRESINSQQNLAMALYRADQAPDALALLKTRCDTAHRPEQAPSQALAAALRISGLSNGAIGELAAAERDLLRSLEFASKVSGEQSPLTVSVLQDLSSLYDALKKSKKAASYRGMVEAAMKKR